MSRNNYLVIAGCLSFVGALLHLICIWGGPEWYRFFGAGEEMARLAEAGDLYPTVVTLVIAAIIMGWSVYAFSGAGIIFKMPFLKTGLVLITCVYLLRGFWGLVLPFLTHSPIVHQNSLTFWLVSSLVCIVFGGFYLLGTIRLLMR